MAMLAIDASILLHAINSASPFNGGAHVFVQSLASRQDIAISELSLVEFYVLLRNPAVLTNPLDAASAVEVVETYRHHPYWALLGFSPESVAVHDELWSLAVGQNFPRRRLYDVRLALSLLRQGVTEFATANVNDFEGLGFDRVWSPLES